jgi:hypothetical protein
MLLDFVIKTLVAFARAAPLERHVLEHIPIFKAYYVRHVA